MGPFTASLGANVTDSNNVQSHLHCLIGAGLMDQPLSVLWNRSLAKGLQASMYLICCNAVKFTTLKEITPSFYFLNTTLMDIGFFPSQKEGVKL